MKKILLLSLFIVQSCFVFAQNCCKNDSAFKELQFPLTVQDTQTVFYYFNNEWIAGANPDMVGADSILKMEVKNDEYGNRAVFITISSEDFEKLKSDVKEATKNLWVNYDPICEFPGGNGLLKEWMEANIQIPDGYKGNERVVVSFYVQPDGTVTDSKIVRPSKNEAANVEALRLVNALPNFRVKFFTPKKHRIGYILPIVFKEPGAIYIRGNEAPETLCQSSFKLVKKNGHYYTYATVNGNAYTPVFVETGFPSMVVSEEWYDKILASLPLEEIKLDKEEYLHTDRTKRRITKLLKGKVPFGDMTYEGRIFVVDTQEDYVTVPVNLLKNEADTTASLIRFDFKKNVLDFVRHENVSLNKMRTYTLVENDPMPIFEATMELSDASGHQLTKSGKFNFDLGNGSSVFFFRKTMLPVLKENKFKLQTSRDKSGNIIGQGIFAGWCKIGDKSNTGFSIGITNKMEDTDELGCVGPSFFKNGIVILDPNNHLIYYK